MEYFKLILIAALLIFNIMFGMLSYDVFKKQNTPPPIAKKFIPSYIQASKDDIDYLISEINKLCVIKSYNQSFKKIDVIDRKKLYLIKYEFVMEGKYKSFLTLINNLMNEKFISFISDLKIEKQQTKKNLITLKFNNIAYEKI